ADVSSLDEVSNMVDEVTERFGQIDILVNNAGIISDSLLIRMSDEAWDDVITTNLNGTFYCTRAVLRGMIRRRWGRIINIGSVVGIRGNIGQVNYSASKAGIIGFTKALAKEVASRNITVNTVTPGYINTDTVDVLPQATKDRIMTWIPQGHFGEVDDVAYMVAFIASEKARYMTGQVVSIDGGMAI
ncbi:MAG: SDR family oxidoreductase, partial [Dehalococcoidia bacterium]|nr:SDR family oxidoreductase [Dehalococcoidia bacterium]